MLFDSVTMRSRLFQSSGCAKTWSPVACGRVVFHRRPKVGPPTTTGSMLGWFGYQPVRRSSAELVTAPFGVMTCPWLFLNVSVEHASSDKSATNPKHTRSVETYRSRMNQGPPCRLTNGCELIHYDE